MRAHGRLKVFVDSDVGTALRACVRPTLALSFIHRRQQDGLWAFVCLVDFAIISKRSPG